jgi:hypothetical protein
MRAALYASSPTMDRGLLSRFIHPRCGQGSPVGYDRIQHGKVGWRNAVRRFDPFRVRYSRVGQRLSRLLTDQTATVNPVKNADPLEVMLPIIRNVQLLRPSS